MQARARTEEKSQPDLDLPSFSRRNRAALQRCFSHSLYKTFEFPKRVSAFSSPSFRATRGSFLATMSTSQHPLVTEVDSSSPVEDFMPTFYVGHHESKRQIPVTEFVLRRAQDVGVCSPVHLN
jgi:hypothetical protein